MTKNLDPMTKETLLWLQGKVREAQARLSEVSERLDMEISDEDDEKELERLEAEVSLYGAKLAFEVRAIERKKGR